METEIEVLEKVLFRLWDILLCLNMPTSGFFQPINYIEQMLTVNLREILWWKTKFYKIE
jgi:hypothetical protein